MTVQLGTPEGAEGACHITSRGGGTVGRGICQSLGSGGRNNAAGTQEVEGGHKEESRAASGRQTRWGPGALTGTWISSQTGSLWSVFAEE